MATQVSIIIDRMVSVMELQTVSGVTRTIGDFPSMTAASAALRPGAYTTFRTYSGDRVLRLAGHLQRLEESLMLMGHRVHLDPLAARKAIAAARVAAGHAESRFRLTLVEEPPACLYVAVEAFYPLPAADYERGVRCMTVHAARANPHAKSTEFISTADQAKRQLPAEVNEGLMVAEDGVVLEGLSSNFFAILGDALRTEEARVLAGLTRALVLDCAASIGLAIERRGIALAELRNVQECFITSVSREILPVVAIDNTSIGAGEPGPRTRTLISAFGEMVRREALPIL
jgi:branched-subunit amino acid aminotransferase/4-amino-4-deoxychorismate lyase